MVWWLIILEGDPEKSVILLLTESLGLGYWGWLWRVTIGGVDYLELVEAFKAQKADFGVCHSSKLEKGEL